MNNPSATELTQKLPEKSPDSPLTTTPTPPPTLLLVLCDLVETNSPCNISMSLEPQQHVVTDIHKKSLRKYLIDELGLYQDTAEDLLFETKGVVKIDGAIQFWIHKEDKEAIRSPAGFMMWWIKKQMPTNIDRTRYAPKNSLSKKTRYH